MATQTGSIDLSSSGGLKLYAEGRYATQSSVTELGTQVTQNAQEIALRATKTEVDAIKIGGRNYILDSAGVKVSGLGSAAGSRKEYQALNVGNSYMDVPHGTQVTISFDLYMTVNTANPILQVYNTNNKGPKAFSNNQNGTGSSGGVVLNFTAEVNSVIDKRVSVTGYINDRTSPATDTNWLEFYSSYGSSNWFSISNIKLEIGNRATDWTPASEDLEAYTDVQIATEVTNRNAAIQVSADAINQSVSQTYTTKTEFSGLEIGGRNLLPVSQFIAVSAGPDAITSDGYVTDSTPTGDNRLWSYARSNWHVYLEAGTYTLSWETVVATSNLAQDVQVWSTTERNWQVVASETAFSTVGRKSCTFTVTTGGDHGVMAKVYSSKVRFKLERGNKATDWTPAPEDIDTRLTTAESSIIQNADNIELKVSKDGVISSINQSSETVKIEASRVEIDGAAIFAAANAVKDTRSDNRPPSWYFTNYPKQSVTEFKLSSAMGLSGDTYCHVTTVVPWSDSSGGFPKQTACVGNKTYWRVGTSNNTWGAWQDSETVEGTNTAINKIVSRGEQLVINGNGFMGNNTNFSQLTFDGSVANGSPGSFTKATPSYSNVFTDEMFPVDPSKEYLCEFDVKAGSLGAKMYAMLTFFDVDKNAIYVHQVSYYDGSTTTLARELKNGDTTVYLTSAAGFQNTTATHQRSLIIWDYTNSYGYTYPAETYSRNTYSNLWDNDSAVNKTNNTITLRSAWTGGTHAAGTPISQNQSGGTYCYFWSVTSLSAFPRDWYHVSGTYSGVRTTGAPNQSGKFWPGTAYCKVGWLWNYQVNNDQSQIWVTNVSVKENVATAKTANAREQTIYRSAAFGTTSMASNGTWVTDATGNQNTWTVKRPQYDRDYPVMFVALQRQTVSQAGGTTCSCTTPQIDETTTIIDGGRIITNSITADAIAANAISADKIAASGLTISNLNADAQSQILNSNISIGGRNMLMGSKQSITGTGTIYSNGFALSETIPKGTVVIASVQIDADDITWVSSGNRRLGFEINQATDGVASGTQYVGVWWGVTGTSNNGAGISYISSETSYHGRIWSKSTLTRDFDSYELQPNRSGIYIQGIASGTAKVSNPKIEIGNKATDWTPAPEDIDTEIQSIEIGGRNLLRFTTKPTYQGDNSTSQTATDRTGWCRWSSIGTMEKTSEGMKYTADSTNGGMVIPLAYENAVEGTESLVLSFDYRTNSNTFGALHLLCHSGGNKFVTTADWSPTTVSETEWVHHSVVVSFEAHTGASYAIMLPYYSGTNKWCEIRDGSLKLERGNKATDWSPAPEDVDAGIASASTTATAYITEVDSNGIKVHAQNNPTTNYSKIDANGLEVFKGGTSVASFGDTSRIGTASGARAVTTSTGVDIYNSSNQKKASYGSTQYIYGGNGTYPYLRANSSGVSLFQSANNHADLTSTGLEVTQGGNSVASFGSTSRIGRSGAKHLELDSTGILLDDGAGLNLFQVKVESGKTTGVIAGEWQATDIFSFGDVSVPDGTVEVGTNGFESGTSQTSATRGNGVLFRDQWDNLIGVCEPYWSTNNRQGVRFGAYNSTASSGSYVTIYIDDSGTRTVAFSESAPWRAALGLGSLATKSSITTSDLPTVTIAKGGTGSTGLTTVSTVESVVTTASTTYSFSSAVANVWGPVCQLNFTFKTTTAITSSTQIGTVTAAYRPKQTCYGRAFYSNDNSVSLANTGALRITQAPANTSISFSLIFFQTV